MITLTEQELLLAKSYRKIIKSKDRLPSEAERQANAKYVQSQREREPIKSMYNNAKSNAKRRGITFTITLEEFTSLCLSTETCPVFDTTLVYSCVTNDGKANDNRASLDRIDSSKPYVPGNVWLISWRANRLKSDSTLDELKSLVLALEARQ